MAKRLQHRGGTTSQHSTFTGAVREVTVDTDKNTLVVHDGATAGGHPLATATNFTSTGIDDNATSTAITIDSSQNVTMSGDLTVDTSTLYVDSSNNKVGISTAFPNNYASSANTLVVGNTSGQNGITIVTSTSETGSLQFADGATGNQSYQGRIRYDHSLSAMSFHVNNGTERMRIDSSGNLLINTTDTNPTGNNTKGFVFLKDNEARFSEDGLVLDCNRIGSDGGIIHLKKDGTQVGSIGARAGDLTIGTGITGITFTDSIDAIRPVKVSDDNLTDNTTDIGSASNRFKDLYLGGGLYVGGTGTANKLDDYEEGTWTPVFADAISGGNSFTMQTIKGEYLKIGDYVKLLFYGRTNGSTTGITTSNQLFIQGLPFTVNTVNGSIVPVHASVLATVQSTLGTIFARALQSSSSMRIEKQYGDTTNPYSTQSLLISEWEGGSGATIEGSITYKA